MAFKKRKIRQKPRHDWHASFRRLTFPFYAFFTASTGLLKKQSQKVHLPHFPAISGSLHPQKKSLIVGGVLIVIGIFLVLNVIFSLFDSTKQFSIRSFFISLVGANLPMDEHGLFNIMLLGIGGEGHSGGGLTDTIMLASLDPKTRTISMLSIPRDLWVNTNKYEQSRINEVMENTYNRLRKQEQLPEMDARKGAEEALAQEVEKFTGIHPQAFAMVNFKSFIEVIDAIGGVDIYVEHSLFDPAYPKDEFVYETLFIPQGWQHFDGATALKYARSRHSTSDFDRAKRQHQILEATKEKMMSMGVLTSPNKLKQLLSVFQNNVDTDLSIGEIVTLAGVGSSVPQSQIVSHVFSADWEQEGGLLGTPPREEYGGASVLIPVTPTLDEIHLYVKNVLLDRDMIVRKPNIEVVNGTKIQGQGKKLRDFLVRYGIPITAMRNLNGSGATPLENTEIWIYPKPDGTMPAGVSTLEQLLGVQAIIKTNEYAENEIDISVIAGKDFRRRF